MRRAILLVAVLLALAGCGGGSSSASGSQPSATSPADPDEAFKLAIQQDGLVPAGNDEAATASIGLAKAVCGVFDAGGTRNAQIRQLAANSSTWDESQADEFIGYAERFYCPKYK